MVGAFGLLDGYHATHFPPDRFVENRQRFDSFVLNRLGAFRDGAVTAFKWGEKHGQLETHGAQILVDGVSIPVLWDCQGRPHFACRHCARRVKHIYLDELVCRRCAAGGAGLDYACRHVHRSLPALHRVLRLRRMAGIDPTPFGVIPRRRRHHLRYYRIVARILAAEEALRAHLQKINYDLRRRARLRGLCKS